MERRRAVKSSKVSLVRARPCPNFSGRLLRGLVRSARIVIGIGMKARKALRTWSVENCCHRPLCVGGEIQIMLGDTHRNVPATSTMMCSFCRKASSRVKKVYTDAKMTMINMANTQKYRNLNTSPSAFDQPSFG